jgi:hypothetical protein
MSQIDQDYVFLPHRLLADLPMNPAAIGVYALIARLFLIYQEAIPLSAADLQRYDPTLSYGAARGALQRLVALHWLNEHPGHKNAYTPAWGAIKGSTQPWRMDAPTLGRPAHVPTLRLDRRLLDIGMGKLVPHPTYPAQTMDRYLEQPIFSLRDVGSYAQALAGRGMAASPALWRYGLLRDGRAQPVPSTAELIALASQRTLSGDGAAPTAYGQRKLGLEPSSASIATLSGQPLFFVDRDLIPDPITDSIPDLILRDAKSECALSAAEWARSQGATLAPHMSGTQGILSEISESPPNPPPHQYGSGGDDQRANDKSNRGRIQPEPASARLLRAINVFPSSIEELAAMSPDLVGRAIAYAQAEPGIESVPGWVVEALRRHRDAGWPIPTLKRSAGATRRDHPIDVESYTSGAYADLFRSGSDTTDLDAAGIDPAGIAALSDARAVVGTERSSAAGPRAALVDDTLTRQVQDELRLRCGRQRSSVIAGLHIQVAGDTTRLICATFADLAIVQNELIGALHGILVQLGAPPQLVFTTRAGWEARSSGTGDIHSSPAAVHASQPVHAG